MRSRNAYIRFVTCWSCCVCGISGRKVQLDKDERKLTTFFLLYLFRKNRYNVHKIHETLF